MKFKAPWGIKITCITLAVSLLLLGIPAYILFVSPGENTYVITICTLISVFLGAMLFIIRGYTISGNNLLVHRLIWNSRIDLSGLVSVEINPEAMSYSIRTFGNGGLFSISGLFRNKTLGSYRAYATDPKRAVVLKYKKRTIVLTPDRPDVFAARIESVKEQLLNKSFACQKKQGQQDINDLV